MATVAELKRELERQRERVENTRERKKKWKRIAYRTGDNLREQVRAVEEAREERNHNRERLIVIRDKLEVIEADGVTTEEREAFARLTTNLEAFVDENEELTSFVHRRLGRIDELDRKHDHAGELRRHFAEELDQAIARRERIRHQLERARRDGGPLDTPFFVVAEFDCHDGTPVPKASYGALKAHVHSYLLPLRAVYGPVHINSAFRTITYNRSIGGASMSVHVFNAPWQHSPWAVAVDHVVDSASPSAVQNWHEGHTHPDGMGRYSSFTHCDNRNRIGWADSRWNGP